MAEPTPPVAAAPDTTIDGLPPVTPEPDGGPTTD
jgi:hypothetical protein